MTTQTKKVVDDTAMTLGQVAARLGISATTVKTYIWKGCPCYTVNGRAATEKHARVRFDWKDLTLWLKSQQY